MIKILKRKFIIFSVSCVFVVLVTIAGIINILNYRQIVTHGNELLDVLSENDGFFPKNNPPKQQDKFDKHLSPEAPYSTRFFTVKFDTQDTIISTDTGKIFSINTTMAEEYATTILNKQSTTGFYNGYKYKVTKTTYGTLIIFVDCTRDLKMFQSFLINSILICSFGITAVFLLVLLLSKRVVAPIVESYEKQKQFITDASHELKTPLAIISANADVIELETGEITPLISIQNQIQRLSSLISKLVSLSRMDEEGTTLVKVDFSLRDAIMETVSSYKDTFAQKGLSLVVSCNTIQTFYGNEESIRQVISILLDNALKYATGDTVTLTLTRSEKKHCITLTNEAVNLEKKNYDILFERFYRLDSSRNSANKGYGIGLCIASAIIQKHKGSIHAFSKDGKTLTFLIKL